MLPDAFEALERVWFNCAHQGPLPRSAFGAAEWALRQKAAPHLIRDEDFNAVPEKLKNSLAQLIGTAPEEVILGNSTSYGLNILRNGVRWRSEDEVLVQEGDFPATVFPWLGMENERVRVRYVRPHGRWLTANEIEHAITPATRVLSISWVNSFTGAVIDIQGIGQLCRDRGITFVVNGSQGVGQLPLDVRRTPLDVLVCCGYKWLCGPYGTGFCWIEPTLRDGLKNTQMYWLPNLWGRGNLSSYDVRADLGSRAFDLFCTANFLNFLPWKASLDCLLEIGISTIEEHNRALVQRLIDGVDNSKYRFVSPTEEAHRSAIAVLSHREQKLNRHIYDLLAKAGIDVGFREYNLRFSLHLYNSSQEVEGALMVLNSVD